MTKYLIVGLGNIGDEYLKTRHNIGFEVIDFIAKEFEVQMSDLKLGAKEVLTTKGRKSFSSNPPHL